MYQSSNIETHCPICYDAMTEENCIKFDCNHTFCQSCSEEMIFNPECECPLDRKSLETIYFQRQILQIVQYQLIIWNERSTSIKTKIDNYWSEIIHHMIKTIKSVIENLKLIKENVENDSTMKNDDLKYFKNIFREYHSSMTEFDFSDCDEPDMLDTVRKIFSQCSEQYRNPLEINISIPIIRKDLTDLYFQIDLLYDSMNIDELNIDRCREMFQDFNDLASEKLQYFISLAISHLSDNEEIYQFAQPHVKSIDINKCLICCEDIDIMKYASFSTCSHKICSKCIDKFMITHASCPFDGKQLSNLLVCYDYQGKRKTLVKVSEYLINNYKSIIEKILNKFKEPIYNLFIEQILEIIKQFPPLMNQIVNKEVTLDNSNIDLINRLQNEYKMAFENIPKESCANIWCNWNIEMYISSLKRMSYMVHYNTLAHDYFNRAWYKLVEMMSVTKRCISFLQIHHDLRQNVLNNELHYELVDKYLQRYNYFLDILDRVKHIELSYLRKDFEN